MEKVFLLMWLGDVVGNISLLAGLITLMTIGGLVLSVIALGFEERGSYSKMLKAGWWLAIPVVVALILPTQTTIRVLALASAGEAATETSIGKKGVEALNAVLDKVIKESKK